MAKKWIKAATQNKGALHRALGVDADKKIPAKKLEAAKHSDNPTIRKEAALAETLKSFHRGGAKRARSAMYGSKD